MKKLLLLAFLAALPASAGFTSTGNQRSDLDQSYPDKFITGFCAAALPAWIAGTESCTGSYEGKTWVELGICSQAEADNGDPLETVECDAAKVTSGACLPGWDVAPKVTIAKISKCRKAMDWYIKSTGKILGKNGLDKLEAQREPTPGDDSGEITD